ncbi:TetR/AcrR family transcriptional regulator [Rhodospirillum centenum]|uniref:Transcriptional regulator, TetR family protein n=1 Tax=Rhodospirillum centenum (strain ATCC 51521 / SW) TaxID=414684 RepID=B6IQI4_RHOCS|nr:TetR/AcrR family transcriptional regulator [Rhodospirillum centenum]ACI97720.1 transcriptional regulator, TetR family protein [Rhodospirillum centenum SW]
MTEEAGPSGSERPGGRTQRLPAAERRAQILRVARDLFVQEGIERTSLRRIADGAGITPTAIYDHFADKQDLLAAIAGDFLDGLIVAMQEEPADPADPLDRLRALGRGYVRYGAGHPHEYRLVFMTTLPAFSPVPGHRAPPDADPVCPPNKGMQSFGVLEAEIARLLELGLLVPGNRHAYADALWATMHGIVSLLITHAHFNWTPVDELVATATDMLLCGISVPGRRI